MSDFVKDILKGRVALVTGGGTGMGKEIARTLGQHGARVVISSRKDMVLQAAAEELRADGVECLALAADIRDTEAVETVVDTLLEIYGRLDVVVNNAAGNFPATIDNISYNGFKTIVDIDLSGTYNVSKACYSKYLKEHGGSVVNITAPFANWGVAYQAHVAAAKTGVESLTRSCAVEWASKGIRVNSVAPGGIADTEGVDRVAEVSDKMQGEAVIGTKQDIANTVLFLASDSASFISGVCIRVDGASTIDMLKVPIE